MTTGRINQVTTVRNARPAPGWGKGAGAEANRPRSQSTGGPSLRNDTQPTHNEACKPSGNASENDAGRATETGHGSRSWVDPTGGRRESHAHAPLPLLPARRETAQPSTSLSLSPEARNGRTTPTAHATEDHTFSRTAGP